MSILHLHVKKKYFDQIKSGEKKFEYRRLTEYWKKKLVMGREYNLVVIYCGYPRRYDSSKIMTFPYRGWLLEINFRHEEFGDKPVDVYAIILRGEN